MEFIEALILGAIQGVTEWLPISSQGVSSIVMVDLFGRSLADALFISGWLHIGTLFAAALYFRQDLTGIARNLPRYVRKPGSMEGYSGLTAFLLAATAVSGAVAAPLVIFGIDAIDFSGEKAVAFVGALLVITGLLQVFVNSSRTLVHSARLPDAVLAGIVQGLSVLPGLSRSGLTTTVLLLRKHDPEYAMKLSFLMSIPAVAALECYLLIAQKAEFGLNAVMAILVAFALGLLTIRSLMAAARRINFGYFCIFLGGLALLAFLI